MKLQGDVRIVLQACASCISKLFCLFLLSVAFSSLFSQSGDLDMMSSYVDGERTYFQKVDFSFEIKDEILTVYDNATSEKKVWRYFKLLKISEDSDDVKSYETEYATIRIYFPEKDQNGLKGALELNIVYYEYIGDWWKFSKKYR